MRRGDRPAPRFGFSTGKGGFWRACESTEVVHTPHSSTRIVRGAEKISPRIAPGSLRRLCQTPTEEPFSLSATQTQNRIATATEDQANKWRLNLSASS